MATQWYDRQGRRVTLGREIGRGGEGVVYEIAENSSLLAKIYERPVSTEKTTKLTAMADVAVPDLVQVSAWPTNLLYDKPNGLLKGFLMPKVPGHCEIHEVYSPAQRKQKFPQADWRFLIHIARNLAVAVEAVHSHGHVIGDLNQKGVLVQPQHGTVKLIDCDSFQIRVNQQVFLCEVGVRDFTPPELQGKSFHGIKRTSNHDNFGLAVLCFQLLFMGRHPFAGRYRGSGDDSLERAIKECRFAYSRTADRKLMEPPPHTLRLTNVSPKVANLFERAFDEAAVQHHSRPPAQEWVQALEELQHSLRLCPHYPIHKYFSSLALCPWCEIEQATGAYLFIAIVPVSASSSSSFNEEEMWKRICNISPPGVAILPNVQPTQPPTPVPLPLTVQARHRWRTVTGIGAFVFMGITLVSAPLLGPFPVLVALLILVVVLHGKRNDGGEAEKRRRALHTIQERWTVALRQWHQETGDESFSHKLYELDQKHTQYLGLALAYQRDRTQLEAKRQDTQRQRFLEHHFIACANVRGLGPGRKATLASYGIETAADITRHAVQSVPGFGSRRTQVLLNWRKQIEAQFHFDPKLGIDQKDIMDLDQRYARKRHDLEAVLLRGETELQQIRTGILRKRDTLCEELRGLAAQLAQKQADVSVLKNLQIGNFPPFPQILPTHVSAFAILAILLFGIFLTTPKTQPTHPSRESFKPISSERLTESSRSPFSETFKSKTLESSIPTSPEPSKNTPEEITLSQRYLTEMIGYASLEGGTSNEPDIFEAKRRIEALTVRTQPQEEQKKVARENNKRGLKYGQAGRLTDSIQAFQEAYQADPGDVEIVNNLGAAYLLSGDLNVAEQFLRKALSLAPGRSSAWANLGQVHAKQGKPQEAVACFANTFRFSRNREITRQFLFKLTSKEGEDEKVKEAAKRALQLALVQAPHNDLPLSSIESRKNETPTIKTQRIAVSVGMYSVVRDAKLLKEPRDDAELVAELRRGRRVNVVSAVGEKWLRVESKHANRPPGYLRTEDAVREENPVKEEEEKSTLDAQEE